MAIPSFPILPGNSWPIARSPSTLTARHEAIGGGRTVNPQRSVPRWLWQIPFEFLRSAYYSDGTGDVYTELEALAGFWNSQLTGGGVFAYTDAEDNAAAAQPFGQGDGATTAFQLVRTYGGFTEPVYAPTITEVTIAGVPTTDYTLGLTGVVTFTDPPPNNQALAWTGTFDWLCRFTEDSLDLGRFMVGLSQSSGVKFSNEIALVPR